MTASSTTDATPAALNSHISLRGCQGPNDTRTICPTETKAAGGLGSIAEQTIDTKVDVVLGGGRNRFLQPLAAGGTTNVVDYAKSKGYQYVDNAAALSRIDVLARVSMLTHAPGGVPSGFVLSDGTQVRVPPSVTGVLARLRVGDTLGVEGRGTRTARGTGLWATKITDDDGQVVLDLSRGVGASELGLGRTS